MSIIYRAGCKQEILARVGVAVLSPKVINLGRFFFLSFLISLSLWFLINKKGGCSRSPVSCGDKSNDFIFACGFQFPFPSKPSEPSLWAVLWTEWRF